MAMKLCTSLSTPTIALLPSHRHTSSFSLSTDNNNNNKLSLPARGLVPYVSTPSSLPITPLTTAARRSSLLLCRAGNKVVAEVLDVTEASWNTLVIGSDTPVLVDFWAPWCGPCRIIAPVIDELAKEYAGKITCFKVNTDDCPNIASQFGIRSIPTVLFFKQGEKKEAVVGAVPKSTLSAAIEKYIDT